MNFSRIRTAIAIDRMLDSEVTLTGAGASFTLASNLVRCGLGRINLIDPQTIDIANVSRQDHTADQVGVPKVDALKQHLLRINPAVEVKTFAEDLCAFSDADIDLHFGDTNLFIAATDHFPAQARVNEVALRLGIPAIFIGLYAGAKAGEIVLWHPEIKSCFRCQCSKRYRAHSEATAKGHSIDPPSDGADIFAIQFLDAIAGQLAIGLLTCGEDNRFGRLIEQLGDRNFIQVKIDPQYTFGGRDFIREQLSIPVDCPAYFSWNTIALSDPDGGEPPCPDCVRFRGRKPSASLESIPCVTS